MRKLCTAEEGITSRTKWLLSLQFGQPFSAVEPEIFTLQSHFGIPQEQCRKREQNSRLRLNTCTVFYNNYWTTKMGMGVHAHPATSSLNTSAQTTSQNLCSRRWHEDTSALALLHLFLSANLTHTHEARNNLFARNEMQGTYKRRCHHYAGHMADALLLCAVFHQRWGFYDHRRLWVNGLRSYTQEYMHNAW